MRLGGATGAPPASRSRNHDRSQPAPPPPMLSQRGFRGRPLPTSIPIPGALVTTSNAPRRTTAAVPATPRCGAPGGGGASGARSGAQPAHRWRDLEHAFQLSTSIGVRPRSRFAPSNTQPQFARSRRSQRARLTPVTLAASARPSSNVPPLRDHERQQRSQRPQNHERPQSRYVRARLRCSSRASLPLTPRLARLLQQLECALPLRFGEDKVTH